MGRWGTKAVKREALIVRGKAVRRKALSVRRNKLKVEG